MKTNCLTLFLLAAAMTESSVAFAPTKTKTTTTQQSVRMQGVAPSAIRRTDPRKVLMMPSPSPLPTQSSTSTTTASTTQIEMVKLSPETNPDIDDSENNSTIWLPRLRQVMAGVALAGAAETAYLTITKLAGDGQVALCGTDGGCSDVLNGPYSNIPFTDIPLAAAGFAAYAAVAALALGPIFLSKNDETYDDSQNRVLLTTLTTAMGTFSIYLMTLLFGVLQLDCPFCIFSAACSVILAKLAWLGGCLPENSKAGARAAGTSFLATTAAALILFVSVDDSNAATGGFPPGTFLTSSATAETSKVFSSPPITTTSSERTLKLSQDLGALNAKMYGAYWCSHCFDQKETFGKEAFSNIDYVECSKDGVDSQTKLCRYKELPGYPTWEINGKLYPGEQLLEELEEIVESAKSAKK